MTIHHPGNLPILHRTAILAIAALFALPTVSQGQQNEATHQLRVNPGLIERSLQDTTQLVRELGDSERVSDTSVTDPTSVAVRLGIDTTALNSGRYTAVQSNTTKAVDFSNFTKLLDEGAVLVSRAERGVHEEKAPEPLMTDDPEATTYALGFELTTREGHFKAWGRDRTGLNFIGSTAGGYVGEFDVALSNIAAPEDRSSLDNPVAVSVTASGASSIVPNEVAIDRLNDWQTVEIGVPNTDRESYVVSISANPQDDGDSISLPVNRARATLTATPSVITGWGIGKTNIRVQVFGAQDPAGYKLALTSDHGTLGEVDVELDSQGVGQVWLWSSRHAGATIDLADVNVIGEAIDVRFESPWIYLALAIAGGLVAAVLKGRGNHQWGRALVVGAISGVVMALLYSVGVNWLGRMFPEDDLARGGEAIVFILGVIGAWIGVSSVLTKPSAEPAAE